MAHGRARGRQHRRGVRARWRAGANRPRDDRSMGKRHRRSARAMERGYAAAQGDVGNARLRRRAWRRANRRAGKRRSASYPDGLARAMVERRLQIFPVWYVQDALDARDATLWHFQIRTETAYNLLGILAGIEPAVLHDVPVQEDAAVPRPDARQAGALRRPAGGTFPAVARRCRGIARGAGARGAGAGRARNARGRLEPDDSGGSEAGVPAGSTPRTDLDAVTTGPVDRRLPHGAFSATADNAAPNKLLSIPFTVRSVSGAMAVGEPTPSAIDWGGLD